MKIRIYSFIVLAFSLAATSCKKDNYKEPTSKLSGKLVYQGTAVEVEYNRVPFELYQYGFGKIAAVGTYTDGNLNTTTTVAPDGTYSLVLFDGDYKFVVRPGQGPFLWPSTGGKADTINIKVSGTTVKDIEVLPYYMVRNAAFTQATGKVTGTFKIEKVISGANERAIERAALFINKTAFVGVDNNIARVDVTTIADPNNISLNVTIPAISPTQNYVFARIGVKAVGVEDWIFSSVQKISY